MSESIGSSSEPGDRLDDTQAEDDDFARGQRQDPPLTIEEEIERDREGTFARGQEVLPEDTVEKDRGDDFARGQEVLPEDTLEKVREGSFAEGQETFPHDAERIEPVDPTPDNVRDREDIDPTTPNV
jgi:hypothetical protein